MAIVEYRERIKEGIMDKKWDDLEGGQNEGIEGVL